MSFLTLDFKGCLEVCAFREQTAAECNGQRWNGGFALSASTHSSCLVPSRNN